MLLLPFVGHLLGLENLWWGHIGSGGSETGSYFSWHAGLLWRQAPGK